MIHDAPAAMCLETSRPHSLTLPSAAPMTTGMTGGQFISQAERTCPTAKPKTPTGAVKPGVEGLARLNGLHFNLPTCC